MSLYGDANNRAKELVEQSTVGYTAVHSIEEIRSVIAVLRAEVEKLQGTAVQFRSFPPFYESLATMYDSYAQSFMQHVEQLAAVYNNLDADIKDVNVSAKEYATMMLQQAPLWP